MPITTCRNSPNPHQRALIVQDYNLIPLAHLALLPGQTRPNCCGGDLTTNYYIFNYSHRTHAGDEGSFFVGETCANDFLLLLGINRLPLFNPIQQIPGHIGGGVVHPVVGGPTVHRPLLNQELYDAINLFLSYYDLIPYGFLLRILNFVRTATAITNDASIKEFNKILGDYHTTMINIITNLHAIYPNLRTFNFATLHNKVDTLILTGTILTSNNI